jgi:nickel-dependent lactate racemase
MTAALPVVKEGGMLILVAECAEGLGSPEFMRMATSFSTAQTFITSILSQPVVIDQWQLEECARAARKAEVILVSPRIAREHRNALFVRTVETLDEALSEGFRKFGQSATVAVIPKGPYTLVELGTT